jgi:hypothetical protein
MDHEWIMKFIDHRIGDVNVHRLISRFLKSGIIENEESKDAIKTNARKKMLSEMPLGAGANIYLTSVYRKGDESLNDPTDYTGDSESVSLQVKGFEVSTSWNTTKDIRTLAVGLSTSVFGVGRGSYYITLPDPVYEKSAEDPIA